MAVAFIDEIDRRTAGCERELRRLGANRCYLLLWMTVPGIASLLAYCYALVPNKAPTDRWLSKR